MKNIKLVLEYEGTNFSGWQKQEGLRTVESELEKALNRATKEDIEIIAAGRTDKKVHALGQVINFHTNADNIPGDNYKRLMDFLLPDDISIVESKEVDRDFHARFDAKRRRYKYIIYNRKLPNAIYRNFSFFFPHRLDIEKMKYAALDFIGEKDFTAFKVTDKNIKVNPIRKINLVHIERREDFILISIEGNSFLHNMVRIMVGTLIQIGAGKIGKDSIKEILESKNRTQAGITAGAEGLFLEKVFYDL